MMVQRKNYNRSFSKKAKVKAAEYRSHIMLLLLSGGSLTLSLIYFMTRGL